MDLTRLRDPGASWKSHHAARLSQATLQAHLRAARHRLRIVLDRALLEARLEVETTSRGLKAMDAALTGTAEGAGGRPDAIPEVSRSFHGARAVARFADELRGAIQDLPEEWTAPAQVDAEEASDPLEPLETTQVAPRAAVDQRLQTSLLTPLEPALLSLGASVQAGVETANDVARLVRFTATDAEATGDPGRHPLQAVLTSGGERVRAANGRIAEDVDQLGETAAAGFKTVESHLIAGAVAALGGEAGARIAGARAGQAELTRVAERAGRWLNRRMAGIWYRRSRGVILTERLRAGGQAAATSVDRLLGVVQTASPDPKVSSRLPFYYRQLFLGEVRASRDLWVPMPRVEAQLRRAIERFELGYEGGLLIVGEPGSGRTSVLGRLNGRRGPGPVVRVAPPPHASADVALFDRHLAAALSTADEPEEALPLLPTGTSILVDDLDLWWERRPGGTAVVERLLDLIDRFGSRLLFVVALTPVTLRLLGRLARFEERFVGTIALDPFSAEELRDVVLVRHRSTGFGLEVDGRPTNTLVDFHMARFFNRLFDRTRGNVGDALRAWIASIQAFEGDTVEVESREAPRWSTLAELSPVQRAYVTAVTLHRRVSLDGLRRIVDLDAETVSGQVAALRRAGILEEGRDGLSVNRYVESELRRGLEARSVL